MRWLKRFFLAWLDSVTALPRRRQDEIEAAFIRARAQKEASP